MTYSGDNETLFRKLMPMTMDYNMDFTAEIGSLKLAGIHEICQDLAR